MDDNIWPGRQLMSRYLVVAHETLTSPHLLERVRQLAQQDPEAEFSVLVPATPVRQLLLRRGGDQRAAISAQQRADAAVKVFEAEGIRVAEATVGDPVPMDAIDAKVAADPSFTGFVISTLPKEHSRWLRQDLPGKVRARYGRPVHHVELPPEEMDYVLP